MKLIRTSETEHSVVNKKNRRLSPWKVLVVDDEKDIHHITKLNLRGFYFKGRELQLISAYSAEEAKVLLKEHPDVALALVDVVMETDKAGLDLVKHIRQELEYFMVRLIVRTGQPGIAPERYVIDHYDIDGYNDKTELTMQKLYSVVRSALKTYNDLRIIDINRIGLSKVLAASESLYHYRPDSINDFFSGVMSQIVSLFELGEDSLISTIEGMIMTFDGGKIEVRAGTGEFSNDSMEHDYVEEISHFCMESVMYHERPEELKENALVLPMEIDRRPVGFVYLENVKHLTQDDTELLQVMVSQCAGALQNLKLNEELIHSYENVVNMLARVAEYKDSTTGDHIARIINLTTLVAIELGVPEEDAIRYGKASRLHDVGKVGITDAVLRKPGKLSEDEYKEIKRHAEIGADILSSDKWMALECSIALNHHERWDGNGYPNGLRGEEIDLATRIVSVVDVYDALVHLRPYKPAWSEEDALTYLNTNSGTQFDPQVVEAFIKLHADGAFEVERGASRIYLGLIQLYMALLSSQLLRLFNRRAPHLGQRPRLLQEKATGCCTILARTRLVRYIAYK